MKSVLIGCGNIAGVHAKVIQEQNPDGLAAAADILPERAEKTAAAYGAKAYCGWEEMLEQECPDVVHICTPHFLHVPMAIKALEQGIHVFLEKPPAINKREWETLKEAADAGRKKSGARLGFCFQNRYNNSVRYIKEQLESGRFGRVLGARGFVTWKREEDYYASSSWRGRMALEAGGALMNQSIHTLDLIQYFVGEKPLSIKAVMDRQHLPETVEVEDAMAAYIAYPAARACLYASNSYVRDASPILELECEKARVRLEDTAVTVMQLAEPLGAAIESKETMDFSDPKRFGKSYWGGGHFCAIQDFYRCVESGARFPIEAEDVENTMWLLFHAYQSASHPNHASS